MGVVCKYYVHIGFGGESVCICLSPLLFPFRGGRPGALSSAYKADCADFTDWMSLLPSNIMEEISPQRKYLKPFISMETLRRRAHLYESMAKRQVFH